MRRPSAVLASMVLTACFDSSSPALLPANAQLEPAIRQGCTLTARKCSRCHPIDRITVARGIGEASWRLYVDEMRLKPSSGISVEDAQLIMRCLVYLEPTQGRP